MNWNEIEERKKALVEGPMYTLPPEVVTQAAEDLKKRTPKSADLAGRAAAVIPGGMQHMLNNTKPYPLTLAGALGAEVTDEDGNTYIDYLMMAGPILLGHNYPPLAEKMAALQRTSGIGTGWMNRWEIEASEKICRFMKNVDMVRFLQSGTEADLAAARLARVYTGKKKILRIGACYHGWSNEFVYDMHIPFSGPFEAHGIPPEYYSQVISVGPNDFDALEGVFKKNADEGIAAMFLEPAGPETGAILFHPDYLKRCRELCDTYGTLLVFDEVVTGFRFAPGGAQEYYGLDADLTILGKVLTHGYPSSGALAGKREIMEILGGGTDKPKPFLAGTMAGNALSAGATCHTLDLLVETGAIAKAIQTAEDLAAGMNDLFNSHGLPFFAYNTASLVHFETTAPLSVDIRNPENIPRALARKAAVDDLALVLLSRGVLTKYGARAFTCLSHTPEHIRKTLDVLDGVCGEYAENMKE